MKTFAWLAMAMCVACHGTSTPAPGVDLGVDLAVIDMTVIASPIGGPCNTNGDCTEGGVPTCFRERLFNGSTLATSGGYCSAKCSSDGDCGANGICVDEGSSGSWCYAGCTDETMCRGTGYACYSGGYCYPSGDLSCDPSAGDGTCTTSAGKPGGCYRRAFGPGNVGSCEVACTVGAATCAAENGVSQQCIVYDAKKNKDPDVTKNDAYLGGICTPSYSTNVTGTSCLDSTKYLADACVDGDQCYLGATFPAGDNLCHPLCMQTGGTSCTMPATCHDIWGAFGSARPVGLCL